MSEGQRQIKRYGWKPSLPDHRDLVADTTGIDPLPEVDPRPQMPEPFDQGQLGSCTGNAVAGAIQYDAILDGTDAQLGTPSRLFIYYCERMIEGTLGEGDTGAFGRDGFKAAHRYGTPPETDWPYDISKYADDPPQTVWADASAYKLAKPYKSVPRSVTQFKLVLSNRQTIAFGFSVYESFESEDVRRTGVVPMPNPSEQHLGGHEVLAVGYLASEPNYVLVRNSWGADWGMSGYFLMPWQYLLSTDLASDFRTIVRATQ
jgi:C1A family cysteine protease